MKVLRVIIWIIGIYLIVDGGPTKSSTLGWVIIGLDVLIILIKKIIAGQSTSQSKSSNGWARVKDYYHGNFDIPFYDLDYYQTKKPLTEEEIARLSEIRRIKYINDHFVFLHRDIVSNPRYRESLNTSGRWDCISIDYRSVFFFLADLLKYKRHEWFIYVLSDEHEAKLLWANKGDDNSSCYYLGSNDQLVELAKANDCNTVICFHNHPHTQDRYWNLLSPSETDINTFERLSDFYNERGLNFIDGLCSQGKYSVYGQSFSYDYIPPGCSIREIANENAVTNKGNRRLRKELRKGKRIRIMQID